ncbi:kinase-like domain-containing protein [Gautieria morchelliformis]|nr:kinase-like domain-containing protein [Gautieria morchelliformis]
MHTNCMGQGSSRSTSKSGSIRTKSLSEAESHHDPSVTEGDFQPVSRTIRDLSAEIQLLGDCPAAAGVVSSIWLGNISNNRRVAVKLFVRNRSAASQYFLREAHVWSSAKHENVMPLLGVARLRNTVALISPWMPAGNLRKYLRAHPEANVLGLMADVACGLAYVHSQGIVYGNLRSSTILVSETGRAYLSSFLVAHTTEGDRYPTQVLDWRISSPEFFSPNSLPLSASQIALTTESDVFAFGTTVMEAFVYVTSKGHYRDVMKTSFLQGKLPEHPQFTGETGLTDDLLRLVNCCWERDAEERPRMAQVARRMVALTEAAIPSPSTRPTLTQRTLKNISAEIKKMSEHPIAGGGYCDLYLGERLGSEKVALKLVRLFGSADTDKDAARRRFLSEARIWAELEHPRILEFYGICEYGTLSLFMVSPFLENGNITHYLSDIAPNADRRCLLIESAEGLLYLHTRQPPVLHGDLKGANILISDAGNAVLADFGLSRISHEETTTLLHGAGSPRWMAPELILAGDEETGPLKSPKTDVYAFGHIMLEVCHDTLTACF